MSRTRTTSSQYRPLRALPDSAVDARDHDHHHDGVPDGQLPADEGTDAASAGDDHDHDGPDDDHDLNDEDLDDDWADLDDDWADRDWERPRRRGARRARTPGVLPGLISEGRSGRRRVDVDTGPDGQGDADHDDTPGPALSLVGGMDTDPPGGSPFSSYDVATRGPEPTPDWLVTALSARDTRLGVLKTGKEADVSLLDRSVPGGPSCLLAVKTYRTADHRMFHRDSSYQEGRRVRRSREGRAMAARTRFGRELLAGKWAAAEFATLGRLWLAGASVPYPVQIIGSELVMEFIGDPDGTAAARLAAHDGSTAEFRDLWAHLTHSLELLAQEGLAHGDLSPYNVLVHRGRCVLIDLPQAVDVVANPQGEAFLERDCGIIADFFRRRGVDGADGELLALHLTGIARLA
ncbi:serine protein kinase RIO [Nakamurella endophytica]|uniref:non-specific serine/threonine protein kinase n=1 Tax=Nakamurella endophytica TaxID=1748367 RepID=A0A917STJ9_9ACTN|nr:RIO1 family regulatory kinase/ATPase [Nakamurella endophytica]GGL95564.1 hypothetical protein GCM10011594_14000 [Nakamurella endophytica]